MALTLCLLFFVSGASALIFETLWFRQAGLMFGNSVWASSIVLASFMGGLALGNGLSALHGGRLSRPLLAYAVLEAAVGIAGFTLVILFPLLTPLMAPAFRPFLSSPETLNVLRLVLAFGLMLLPATAMGATLPILVRALSARESDFGRALGRLYGWNTLGAVAGSLAGEALLIDRFGLRGTGAVAAILDGLAVLGALGLSRRWDSRVAAADAARAWPRSGPAGGRLLAAAFLAGGILLALEVVWFRFLLLFVSSSSLAFATMLAVVLLGIAAGGFAASWWLRWQPGAQRFVPMIALASGLATSYTYIAFPDVLQARGSGSALYPQWQGWPTFSASAPLMLPACFFSGVLFTLLGKALKERIEGEARAAGALALANTVGAMLGALLGGFVLLPRLGMERSFFALAAAYGVVALCTLGVRPAAAAPKREALYLSLAGIAFLALLVLFPFGLMRNYYFPLVASRWMLDGSSIAAIREGLTETIIYLRKELWGESVNHRLITNSFSMSGTSLSGLRYMRLFVYWPMALHPDPKRALLISYGMGNTAKALTDAADLESIDIVDISRDILETSHIVFSFPEKHPLDDPRVRVHVEDGRFFLLTTDRTYDLITAEPPPPRHAGIVNLYSREYFRLLHDRLAEGGLATYWLPVYQLEPSEAKAVIGAFCASFEDCSLWTGFGLEWMLAGTRGARGHVSEDQFTRQWRDPVVGPALREVGLEAPEKLGALFVADAPLLKAFTADVLSVEDDHPERLTHGPRDLRSPAGASYLALMDAGLRRSRFAESAFIHRLWPERVRARTLDAFQEQGILDRFFLSAFRAAERPGLPELNEILARSRLRTPVLWFMGSGEAEQRIATSALRRGVADPLLDERLGIEAMADRDYLRAERGFREAQRHSMEAERLAQWRVLALCLAGETGRAANLMREADEWIRPKDPEPWRWLARTYGLPEPFGESVARFEPSGAARPDGERLLRRSAEAARVAAGRSKPAVTERGR